MSDYKNLDVCLCCDSENIEILSKGYEEPKRYATGFFDREFNPKFLLYLAGGVISLWLLLALLESLTHQL